METKTPGFQNPKPESKAAPGRAWGLAVYEGKGQLLLLTEKTTLSEEFDLKT